MSTSFLTRDEMHDRVNLVFDKMDEALDDEDDEPIAVVGSMVGNMSVNAPTESRDHFSASPTFGYASFTFDDGDAFTLGEALRTRLQREIAGTVVVPKTDLHPTVVAAIDGDEDAREQLAEGTVNDGGT